MSNKKQVAAVIAVSQLSKREEVFTNKIGWMDSRLPRWMNGNRGSKC